MPATEDVSVRRTRTKSLPPGLSADALYLGEKLDAVEDRITALEAKAPSPKLLVGAGILLVIMFFAGQVYMVSLIAGSRGVDLGAAAEATKVVVGAGSDAAKAAVIEDAPLPAVPAEPAAAPPAEE